MNNQSLSFVIVLAFSFLLMLVASYLANFQSWLVFQQDRTLSAESQRYSVNQVVSGIRMVSGVSASSNNFSPPPEPDDENAPMSARTVSKVEQLPQVNGYFADKPSLPVDHRGGEKNHSMSPSFIQYPDALVIEVPSALATPSNLKRMIYRVLLSPAAVSGKDLLSTTPIKAQHKPWFYRQVVNQAGQPIRYPAAASEYADYLLQAHTQEVSDEDGSFVLIQIPRIENRLLGQVEKYKPWVDRYARQFDVPRDLVFAIMEVESAFNPRAVSKSNALGLMQIKAGAAGRDVYQYVDGRSGQPSEKALFDAKNNIRMGIAYMGLLKHDYLLGVRNPEIKEMLSISSYNAGISRTLKLFADTPEEAIFRVNQLHPKRVYRTLRYEHASSEARQYLDKVLDAKKRYSELLGLSV